MSKKVESIGFIATVLVSGVISILDLLGILDTVPVLKGRMPAITLLVIAVVAGYLISERFGRLERIERSIDDNADRILASLSGVEARLLSTAEEAFEYMAEHIAKAEQSIDHAALAAPIPRRGSYTGKWEAAIARVLKKNKALYRYIALFADEARLQRVKQHLTDPNVQKYYVRYYDSLPCALPTLSFIVIDNREVIMHYPYEPGQPETFLAIAHPDVVRLFSAYYRNLWAHARPFSIENISQVEDLLSLVNPDKME